MPRRNAIRRDGHQIVVVIDGILHRLSDQAFVDLMQIGLGVLQSLQRDREMREADERAVNS